MNNNTLNPVRAFGGLMEELFNGKNPRFFQDDFFNEDWTKQHRRIPVNISENSESYQLAVVAPGLRKEDLKINIQENVLSIAFEKTQTEGEESSESNTHILRQEFQIQSFKRSFKLGEKVDADKISARYENGVLYLNIAKKEEVKASNKSIDIA